MRARVRDSGARSVVAQVLDRRLEPKPVPAVAVFPAVPKHGKLELVVQKLTELGVERIVPWFAEHTVVRWGDEKRRAHGQRLRAVAREAVCQSGRAWMPEVADPGDLPPLPACVFVLHESARERLSAGLPEDPPAEVGLVVGPEGGLSDEEVRQMIAAGARVAGLGPLILRAETAAIVTPALVLARYGRIG